MTATDTIKTYQMIRYISFPLFFMLLFTQFVCGQNNHTYDKKLHILTLGDSNGTFPYSWPEQLKLSLPNSQIYNISKSSRTIGFLNLGDSSLNSLLVIEKNLQKAADVAGDQPYDYIVIDLGTNDAKAIFNSQQELVPKNLDDLITSIQTNKSVTINKAKILIVSPTPYGTKAESTEKYRGGGMRVKAMAKSFKTIAKQKKCLFVDGYKTPGLNMENMSSDGLHMDAIGSAKLAQTIIAVLKKHEDSERY